VYARRVCDMLTGVRLTSYHQIMELETKMLSRQIQEALYDADETLGTAESCTGGRIAEAIIAVPGASSYFKGGIIAYASEVKESLLHVSHAVLEEQTAVCEEVAREMVTGACDALGCTYAISATGIAGPTGGTSDIPVGTIWIGYGSKDDVRTFKLTENFGRDINLAIATNKALQLFLDFLNEKKTVQVPAEG
jgi:nicotinamide-nucleotide amidase